ncbi:acyl-CoA hydrolase [Catenuloplanes nepalensis]|uniref:Acyl-CoA hydrolase n=1 Tax=Catenuloplanes nepalensis TaxID=587533 RepID=A0ABT9MNQ8_9ACTN|nr:LUD domain-containing protein [Catenuloplanes nepalensis]MDP9792696.1 acyl-CoA hydrolase [Catenuloplanes nepalensis]
MPQFDVLPDEETVAATVAALAEHGIGAEVVDDLAAARKTVLARIPHGATVFTNTSVTLDESGISAGIDDPEGPYESARLKMLAFDFATQRAEMKEVSGTPDYALGSVQAITRDGGLLIGSAGGSQLANIAWGAANVILVAGLQKLVPDMATAHRRLHEHSLELEHVRAQAAYGRPSQIGKILEIHKEQPGRIHLVLIRQVVGF